MLVALPQPFDFALSTERFRAFGPDLANLWRDGALHRVFDGREVRIEPAPGGVRIDAPEARLARPVARYLGAPFDLEAFAAFAAASDRTLAVLAARLRGFRPPLSPDPFETLVTSITAQQVSLRAACAIRNRLIGRFSRRHRHAFAFPGKEALAAAPASELLATGLSTRKAAYVGGLARSDLDLVALAALPDEEVKARLRALPGIGEWTADWFLARHLARSDAWPAGDLGLQKAVSRFYLDGVRTTADEVRRFGERFSPFRNLAAHYLLTGLRVGAP